MPSAVDSSVAWSTETVRESATLRGFFARLFDGGFFVVEARREVMGPNVGVRVTSVTGGPPRKP